MAEYLRADKQILVALLGLTSSLLTGAVLGLIEVYFGYAIYSWMFWFVVPAGAVLAGFGASSGYYAGAMLSNQKPAGGVLFNMVAASLSAFLIINYIPYFMLEVDGIRVKEVISFWRYFDINVRSTSLSSLQGGFSTGELGSFWGYAFLGLQLLGFSVGGFTVFAWLSENPYCEKCSRYFKKTGVQKRFTSDGKILIEQINTFAELLAAQQYNKAIRYHAENMGVEYGGGHHLSSRIITRICHSCGANHLDFITSKLNGDTWKDINENKIRIFTDESLKILAKA